MNILVTGGAGFIGKYLVKYLLEKDHTVTIFDNKIANQIGTTNNNKLLSDSQKSKELSNKISQCVSKINQMPYNELLIVIEQHSIGGVEPATNYILTGTRVLRFKRSKIT